MCLTGLPAAVNSIRRASSSTVVVFSTNAAAVGAIDILPSDLRNHVIDMKHEFDRPDGPSREPIAHIRQYCRARASGVAVAITVADHEIFKSNQSSRASC